MSNIRTSGFSLAKGKELLGDDFYEVRTIDNLTIAIVCDGVGSASEGAEAAKRVTNYLINNFKSRPKSWSIEKSIKTFISSINEILYQDSMLNYQRPELVTTLALVIIEGDRLYGANVGDSRVYLKRDGKLTQLSYDHVMGDGYDSHVLAQAVGIDKEVNPYYFENIVQKGDKILLCSDGLYTILDEEQLSKGITQNAHFLVKSASRIMKDDLPDDTTAIVIEIDEIEQTVLLKRQSLDIPESLKAGQIIDGYILKKSLIQNDRTWLCEKKGVKVVLKFAPYEANENEEILDLFVKEAWNARRLKAGFFPKAFIPQKRTKRYYVMEYLEGQTLKDYLKKRKLSVEDSINLAKTLLKMSQYLMKFNLVHGDIKPENIMVITRKDKHIFKIIDFGSITEIYSITSKAGTPSYLAPERFRGDAINESTEIFAIGVTLYNALTKDFPYGEIEPFQTPTFKTPKSPKKLNPTIPNWLDSIILRAISSDSDLRYKNYTHMMYELENPNKVVPFYNKNESFISRNPLLACRIGFVLMLIINLVILIFMW